MSDNRLKIVTSDSQKPPLQKQSAQKPNRQEIQAKLERLWLNDPKQFDPERNSFEKERIERTCALIDIVPLSTARQAVDLGCGTGKLSRKLHSAGWHVQAVDAAGNALKQMSAIDSEGIEMVQDVLPNTRLDNGRYDLVLSTEVIGFLSPSDYRLYFSELSRLMTKEGYVICSSLIEVDSEDALQKFGALVETEFQVDRWIFGYHRLWLQLKRFFNAPAHFIRGSKNRDYLEKQMIARKGFSLRWYKFNSSPIPVMFWHLVNSGAAPLASIINNNRWLLLKLEKISKFLWDDAGISHVIFLGQRRRLETPTMTELASVERKGKHQVWE